MRRWAVRCAAAAVLVLGPGFVAWADVVPPAVVEARQRLERNPKAFDRVDAYCDRRGSGAACVIPGTRFEGGGPGRCESRVVNSSIELACKPDNPWQPVLPAGPYQGNPFMCRDVAGEQDTRRSNLEERTQGQFVCRRVPVVHDRACASLRAGDACEVVEEVRGQTERSTGRCATDTEAVPVEGSMSRYSSASRPVVVCKPDRPAPRTWRDLGVLEKLLQ